MQRDALRCEWGGINGRPGTSALRGRKVVVVDMAKDTKPNKNDSVDGSENLQKVREILFGAQARESETRQNRLEERLTKESVDLRNEIRRRFESLEQFVKAELESVMNRLRDEQSERNANIKELSQDISDASKSHEARLQEFDDRSTREQQGLRSQIFDQSTMVRDELRERSEQLSAVLDKHVEELRVNKVDRAALSKLFAEFALRLGDESDTEPDASS